MFEKFSTKIVTFADHHQILLGIVIAFSIICVSWGTEKLLEKMLFPQKPVYGYTLAVIGGLSLLWLTQHVVLNVI
jgi:hypothetical protein